MGTKSITVTTAHELADALGLTPADAVEWEIRYELSEKIISALKRSGMTHAALARAAQTSRSRVTAILNRNLSHVSTDLLIRLVATLGYRLDVKFKKTARAA